MCTCHLPFQNMRNTSFVILFLLTLQLSQCEVISQYSSQSLVDQFNDYFDQTIELINQKQTSLTSLPFYFNKGTWGYLILDVDYSLKLYNGSITGINRLRRSGDAFIGYDKTTGNLTISATLISQQVQSRYAVELKLEGLTHQGLVVSSAPALNISVNLSVSAANLRASLDSISVTTRQAPNVTFTFSNQVLDYFAPLVTDLGTVTSLTSSLLRASVQATINTLNSPSLGYY